MTRIQFFAPGIPKAQPRPRAFARKMGNTFVARVYDAGTAENFKSQIALAGRPHIPLVPLQGPLSVTFHFFFPRLKAHFRSNGALKPDAPYWHTSKPDTENVIKAALDAMTILRFWSDDKQACKVEATKTYSDRPGVEIIVEPLSEAVEQAEQKRLAV